jgi:hypothetical protein
LEGAGSRQGVRAGPITDTLGRPSQGVLENRTAADLKYESQNLRDRCRRAVIGIHAAELQVLIASQRAARRAAVRSIHAALSGRHAGAIAAVVAKFAGRRTALASGAEQERAATLHQLSTEEAQELARLALEHAADKRALRQAALVPLATRQRTARRDLRRRNRRQQIVIAIQLDLRRHGRSTSARRIRKLIVTAPGHRTGFGRPRT